MMMTNYSDQNQKELRQIWRKSDLKSMSRPQCPQTLILQILINLVYLYDCPRPLVKSAICTCIIFKFLRHHSFYGDNCSLFPWWLILIAMKLIITVCIVTAVRTVNDPFLPHTSWRYMSWRITTLCLACLLREKTW